MPKGDVVLLDTHALLWWKAGAELLSDIAARRIAEAPPTPSGGCVGGPAPGPARGPVDRLIVASALARRVPVVTKDRLMHAYAGTSDGFDVIW